MTASTARTGRRLSLRTGTRTTALAGEHTGYGFILLEAPDTAAAPDAFVLLGHDVSGTEVFRKKLFAKDATPTDVERSNEPGGSQREVRILWFHYRANENHTLPEKDAREVLFGGSTVYTLMHQPGGDERGAYPVFTGRPWHYAFGSHFGPTFRNGYPHYLAAEDAEMAHARSTARFTAAQVYLSDGLAEPTPGRPERWADRNRMWRMGTTPTDFDFHEANAERAPSLTVSGGPRSAETPDAKPDPPRSLHRPGPPPPGADAGSASWLTFYARARGQMTGPVWGAVAPADADAHRERVEDQHKTPVLLGVWLADDDGHYRYAAFEGNASSLADDDVPEAFGPPSPFVLLPAVYFSHTTPKLYAHVFYGAPPWARVRYAVGGVGNGVDHLGTLTPIAFKQQTQRRGPRVEGVLYADADDLVDSDARDLRWDHVGGLYKVFLADPLRTPIRLAEDVRRAQRRVDAWTKAVVGLAENAGLVAAACYHPAHHRSHLQPTLAGPEELGIEGEWALEGGRSSVPEPSPTRLDHVRYGLARQQELLAKDLARAAARLEAWTRAATNVFTVDLVAASRPGGMPTTFLTTACEALFDAFEVACSAGQPAEAVRLALRDAGVLDVLANVRHPDELGAIVDPLREAEAFTWTEALEVDSTLKMWWTVARRFEKQTAKFGRAVVAPLVSEAHFYTKDVSQSRLKAAPPIVAAHLTNYVNGLDPAPAVFDSTTGHSHTVYRAEGMRVRIGTLTAELKNVHSTQTRSYDPQAGRYGPGEHWSFDAELVVTKRAAVLGAVDTVDGIMALANAVMLGVSIGEGVAKREGLDVRDFAVGVKAAGDIVGVYQALGKAPAGWALTLQRAGPYADVVIAVYDLHAAWEAMDQRGLREIPNVDEQSFVGAGVALVGGIVIVWGGSMVAAAAAPGAAAVGGTAALGWTLIALGTAGQMLSTWILWDRQQDIAVERRAADGLNEWLDTASVWGPSVPLGEAALALAKPGWDGTMGLGVDFAAQTEGFVEAAFTFPTRLLPVGAVGADGAALAVEVIPEYLPGHGALLLSVDVESTASLGGQVEVRCVVRYAKVSDGGYRYDVVPEGAAESAAAAAARAAFARRTHAPAAVSADPMQGGGFSPVFPAGTRPVPAHAGWASSSPAPDGSPALVVRVVEPGAPTAAGTVAVAGVAGGSPARGTVFYRPLAPDDLSIPAPTARPGKVAFDAFLGGS